MAGARPFIAVLDSSVLVPPGLRDLLLSFADVGLFRPVWQDEIEIETARHAIKRAMARGDSRDVAEFKAARTIWQMNQAFPDAKLPAASWITRTGMLSNHLKDRHVLAAAIGAKATHLVTKNTKDFPEHSQPANLSVSRPDPFLLDLIRLNEGAAVEALSRMAARHRHPAHTTNELADLIAEGRSTPRAGMLLKAALSRS